MPEIAISSASGAQSGALDAADDGLSRLAEHWPMLSGKDRAQLVASAEHLASLRPHANSDAVDRW